MSRFAILLFGALSLILGRHGSLAAYSAQYYHPGSEDAGPTFSVAMNTWKNESTHATDLVFTFGYERKYDRGWAAIGLGESMFPSLIFMTYGLQTPSEDLVISVREGREYSEPRPAAGLPQVEMRALSFSNSSRWLETSFICFGCGDWAAKRRAGKVQSFIWAFNPQDDVANATVQSEVWFHAYTGTFTLDMSDIEAIGFLGVPVMPPINPARPNQPDMADEVSIYSALVPAHGALFGLAMLVLYPCGILSIRHMPNRIPLYLFFQVFATVSCVMGAAAIFYAVMATGWVDMLKEPHAILGMIVLLLILPQLFFGYVLRKKSTSLSKSERYQHIHLWLGRAILFGGCINTIVGLESAGFSTGAVVGVSLVAIFDFVVIMFPPYLLRRRANDFGSQRSGYEAVVPLLDNGEELK
ncbi:hypothetical protein GQ53DRAFT_265669 [Thozetella sp. PMI_491]|nr:hypothetical protein GQ53DRAFT_265669 [Thozetella sp. PMI_491]